MKTPANMAPKNKPRYHTRQLLSAELMNGEVAWLDFVRAQHRQGGHGGGKDIPATSILSFDGESEIVLQHQVLNKTPSAGVVFKKSGKAVANICPSGISLNSGLSLTNGLVHIGELAMPAEAPGSPDAGAPIEAWSLSAATVEDAPVLRLAAGSFSPDSLGSPSRIVIGRKGSGGVFTPHVTIQSDGRVEMRGNLSVLGRIVANADKEGASEALPLEPAPDKIQPAPSFGTLLIEIQEITDAMIDVSVSVDGLEDKLFQPKFFMTLLAPGKLQEGPVLYDPVSTGPLAGIKNGVKAIVAWLFALLKKIKPLASLLERVQKLGGRMLDLIKKFLFGAKEEKPGPPPKSVKENQKVHLRMPVDRQRWAGVDNAILVAVLQAETKSGKRAELASSTEISFPHNGSGGSP